MIYLISVIIPVYNVEKYLDKCVQSVADQTYNHLEIILVDDGSSDSCPRKCDEWASKDSRIKVIHKTNGGLSDARNMGLSYANGDFVSFIDSNDFIEKRMYEILLNAALNNKVDVSACRIRRYKNGVYKKIKQFVYKNQYSNDAYIRDLLLRRVDCASWNKLYSRKFISDSKFIKGRNNEDIIWLFYQFYNSDFKICYVNDCLYNYRVTQNSITNSKINYHSFDCLLNIDEMKKFDLNNHNRYQKELSILLNMTSVIVFWQIYRHKAKNKYQLQYGRISKYIKRNICDIILSRYITWKDKIKSMFVFVY